MMIKRVLILSYIAIVFLDACVPTAGDGKPPAPSVAAPSTPFADPTTTVESGIEDLGNLEDLDLEAMADENNRLFEQLQVNTPIQVSPANRSARTVTLTIPTLF